MSLIAVGLNLFLTGLLLFALWVGLRLDRRLRGLKDTQQAFRDAAVELNAAVGRAQIGLAELRGGADEALDLLGSRINRAREQAERLERAVKTAEGVAVSAVAVAAEPRDIRLGGGLDALLADLKRAERPGGLDARTIEPQARPTPRRMADDDLFVTEPEGRA